MGLILGCVLFNSFKTYADGTSYSISPKTDTILDINTATPPAMIWVVDSLGNITGADATLPVNRVGEQTQDWPNGLYGIPNSRAVQKNIENDEPGDVEPITHWDINIKTTATQSYILNVKGIIPGICKVGISGCFPNDRNVNHKVVSFLVDTGTLRQAKVDFNPGMKQVKFTRIIGAADLLDDVKTACQLGKITSAHVCKRLKEKAEAIQDALKIHLEKQAVELSESFLHSLGDSRPEGCKDDDDHDGVKEPALTILIEDAKALLKSIENSESEKH